MSATYRLFDDYNDHLRTRAIPARRDEWLHRQFDDPGPVPTTADQEHVAAVRAARTPARPGPLTTTGGPMGFTRQVYDRMLAAIGPQPGPFWVRLGDRFPQTKAVALDRQDFVRIEVGGPLDASCFWLYDRHHHELGCFPLEYTERFGFAGGLMSLTVRVTVGDRSVSPQEFYDPADTVWDPSVEPSIDEAGVLTDRAARSRPEPSRGHGVRVGPPKAIGRGDR